MNEEQITALDKDQLRTLLNNARKKVGPQAELIIGLAEAELNRRTAKKPTRRTSLLQWTKHGGTYAHAGDLYECRVGEQVVATVRKLTNHSGFERNVYEATVQGRMLNSFEKIEAARQSVEAELLRLGICR